MELLPKRTPEREQEAREEAAAVEGNGTVGAWSAICCVVVACELDAGVSSSDVSDPRNGEIDKPRATFVQKGEF